MNEELYDEAKRAIETLFNDESVSKEDTKANLEGLIGEIEIMIDSLDVE